MDQLVPLLQLLFGQTGVVGTILIAIAAYFAYLYNQERNDHKETRRLMNEAADKRAQVLEAYIKGFSDIKTSIDILSARRT